MNLFILKNYNFDLFIYFKVHLIILIDFNLFIFLFHSFRFLFTFFLIHPIEFIRCFIILILLFRFSFC
jgi:hypothetical protein